MAALEIKIYLIRLVACLIGDEERNTILIIVVNISFVINLIFFSRFKFCMPAKLVLEYRRYNISDSIWLYSSVVCLMRDEERNTVLIIVVKISK